MDGQRAVYCWSKSCPHTSVLPKLSSLDVLIGRSLAMCAHPYAAWRTRSTAGRLFVVLAYSAASYGVVLGALLVSR